MTRKAQSSCRRNQYREQDVVMMARRRKLGETWKAIASDYNTSADSVREIVKYHGRATKPTFHRRCRMPDCDKEFTTTVQHRVFCCTEHRSRQLERERKGLEIVRLVCAVPECDKRVWALHKPGERPSPRYCCKDHGDLHHRRIKYGIYERLTFPASPCEVCGEPVVVDDHHEEFSHGRSNKSSKEHVLCCTCHMRIHRGLARYENGRYVDLTEVIRRGLIDTLRTYDDPRLSGSNWIEAKQAPKQGKAADDDDIKHEESEEAA